MGKASTLSCLDNDAKLHHRLILSFVAHDFPDGIIDPVSDVFKKDKGSFLLLSNKDRVGKTLGICSVSITIFVTCVWK